MRITLEQVREELAKDDLAYINSRLECNMRSAKSSLLPTIGLKADTVIPEAVASEFEELSNTYIVEYCRALVDGADNEKILLALLIQLQALLTGGDNG